MGTLAVPSTFRQEPPSPAASSLLFPSFLKSSCGTGVSYRGLLCQFV